MEDYTRLWVRLIWFVHSCPMRIFKWTPDFHPNKESPLTPIWVHFHGLLLYLFEGDSLLSVANSTGKPLRIDSHNVNRVKLGTASACVELDVSKPLMKETWLDDCKRDLDKEQGKGPKPTYINRRRSYRRVVNPAKSDNQKAIVTDEKNKNSEPHVSPSNVASSSGTKASDENKDDFVKFSRPAIRDVQPEPDESVSVGDPKDNNDDALLLSVLAVVDVDLLANTDPTHRNGGDNHVGENGFEVHQCREIVDQSGDTKVRIAAIDVAEINVPFHVDSAPSSPKDPERLNITCSESVGPEENYVLVEDMAEQHIDKSPEPFPHVE
ncbi:hypothetical protein LIER_27721 [Lithospermum erythrorhizon]|uniref:DUF4283 domain-containing protein n=1 Tax=Lithospermum erythrorhizon TaxID=34254 RepID=A0AAV3REK7_LITER